MLSAPPVNSSLLLDRPSALPQPKSKALTYGVLGAASFLVLWFILQRNPSPASKGNEGAAPATSALAPQAAAQPLPTATSSIASAPGGTASGAPSSSTAAKEHRASPPGATHAAAKASDDYVLFPGRK